jgi:hypothetical protein
MIVGAVPQEVKAFFSKAVGNCSKPIQQALAPMVLALLLAPHRRCLKTIAGQLLAHRCHVATISRRLTNPQRRQWIVAIDTTYHATMSEQMENLIVMSRRQNRARNTTRQHAFLMGLVLTDRGASCACPTTWTWW